jgi:hypothetical protein
MKQLFLVLCLPLFFTSCYTSQGLASRITSQPVVLTKTLLTGLYENNIPDDPENSLWNDLCLHHSKKVHDPSSGNQVFIEYTDEKEIKVELYQSNQLLDSMILSGKPKDNYFVIRKGSHFFTLILITSTVSKKTILGNDANADLLLAQGRSSNTMFLESEVGDEGETITATYMRLGDIRPN